MSSLTINNENIEKYFKRSDKILDLLEERVWNEEYVSELY